MAKPNLQATIASTGTVSSVVEAGDYSFFQFQTDENFVGATLTIKAVSAGGTTLATYKDSSTAQSALVVTTTGPNSAIMPVGELATALAALDRFTLTSTAAQTGTASVVTIIGK